MACYLANDPAVIFAAGAITAAVTICVAMVAIDAIWPGGKRPPRRPKTKL